MSQGDVITIFKDTMITAILMASPFLGVSLIIGVIVSVFQAATQIHEQNVIFVPKILATALLLIFLASWLMSILVSFTQHIISGIQVFVK